MAKVSTFSCVPIAELKPSVADPPVASPRSKIVEVANPPHSADLFIWSITPFERSFTLMLRAIAAEVFNILPIPAFEIKAAVMFAVSSTTSLPNSTKAGLGAFLIPPNNDTVPFKKELRFFLASIASSTHSSPASTSLPKLEATLYPAVSRNSLAEGISKYSLSSKESWYSFNIGICSFTESMLVSSAKVISLVANLAISVLSG